ncbi:MAG: hypothetical protein ACODUE_03440 [Synechococcus sp.]
MPRPGAVVAALLPLLLGLSATMVHSQNRPRQTMQQAAEALQVCRRIPKSDRDRAVGEQAALAWVEGRPDRTAEALRGSALLAAMGEVYADRMRTEGQLIAMGCSQGVMERALPQQWSAVHEGARDMLIRLGMGDRLSPGVASP